LSRRSVAQPG